MSPRSAVPMAAASRAIRTNPSRRDSTVPAAITAAERRVRSAILRPDSFFQAFLGVTVRLCLDGQRVEFVGRQLEPAGRLRGVERSWVERVRSGGRGGGVPLLGA